MYACVQVGCVWVCTVGVCRALTYTLTSLPNPYNHMLSFLHSSGGVTRRGCHLNQPRPLPPHLLLTGLCKVLISFHLSSLLSSPPLPLSSPPLRSSPPYLSSLLPSSLSSSLVSSPPLLPPPSFPILPLLPSPPLSSLPLPSPPSPPPLPVLPP